MPGPPASSLHPTAWRVFCALQLPQAVVARVTAHIKSLCRRVPDNSASWTTESNLHLTIKFLGNIAPSEVSRLSLAAERATTGLAPFDILINGAGVFPNHGAPKVLWLGIEDRGGLLAALQAGLEQECAEEGFAKEESAFRPHLTIARPRKPLGARELAVAHQAMGFAALAFPVSELLVIRSEPGSSGSRYTTISRHPLGV